MTPKDLDNLFTHHAPAGNALELYAELREKGKALAMSILECAPSGPDQDAAIRKVREAVMTANAAVACGGES